MIDEDEVFCQECGALLDREWGENQWWHVADGWIRWIADHETVPVNVQ